MYAKVGIPRRSASNRRKRDSTKETSTLADLKRLMTDPNLRCQVAHAMVAALQPFPDSICISDITTDMAGVMFSTAAELAPRSKRTRGAQGTRSRIGGGGRGCNKFVPVLEVNSTKIASTGDMFDQPPGQMR